MRWHRRVLLGEAVHSNDVLRFVRRDIRAALATLTLTVIFCIPALLLAVAAVPLVMVSSSQGAIPVFMSAALLGAIVVSGRFMLIYPLCAVDAPPSLIGTAWRMTKGNTLRLLAVMLGACIPPSVLLSAAVALLEGGIAEQPEGPLRALPAQLVQTTIWFVQIALASSAASFVFRGLGGVAAPPVSTAA